MRPAATATAAEREQPRGFLSGLAPEVRRQVVIGLVVLHYLLVIGLGGWYNFVLYSDLTAARQEVAGYQSELAMQQVVAAELNAARAAREELEARRLEVYGLLPDAVAVPTVVGRLEALAAGAGGRLVDVQYSPPDWNGDRGQVYMSFVFEGGFGALQNFVASVNASVPSLRWDVLEVAPADAAGREIVMYADIQLDVVAERPAGAARWEDYPVQAVEAASLPNPFVVQVPVRVPLPELALRGVVHQNGRSVALLSVDGETHFVEMGHSVAGLTVVNIAPEAVVVRNGDRTVEVRLND